MSVTATYRVRAGSGEIESRARALALEQTAELPEALVPPGFVADQVVADVTDIAPLGPDLYQVTLTYNVDQVAGELTQLLNTVFGNLSLADGVRLADLALPADLAASFGGPRFGLAGLRQRLGVAEGPLTCTAIKPMGLPVADLAEQAYRCALGGIDIVKDDHGLTDQPWAPFAQRLEAGVAAVARANRATGGASVFCPNVTGDGAALPERARQAAQAGAGAILVAPGLVGLDRLNALARDAGVGLPILAHPSYAGTAVMGTETGIEHGLALGDLPRLAGADAVIFPNYGGRFGFSRAQCEAIVQACRRAVPGDLRAAAPMPGGGMKVSRVADMQAAYGADVGYLIGAGLYEHDSDPAAGARRLLAALGRGGA